MAGARRTAPERGKSVPIDAEAVAQVAPREPNLPKACLDGPSRHIKLLVDQRGPVTQRTAIGNKLRRFLHELDPEPSWSRTAAVAHLLELQPSWSASS
ncbi:hypothetical protein [Streptomyces sp. YU58]|uniref:hypothetical protein n=1 Tax=Streptomyces sp. SX92 TaxID=3158972 RepID=UPI0027BA12AC|nr:hypothetical protein [Streptomyces coralus]WLW57946.1 hypothetical protein QU709_44170 [Streptomyces coralus]